ncbi:putative Zinc-regulated transporter 2 [Glarea lozoyensis 74030]|uniref:Putative Zinc-regulated transporter 2 n=1 Tax=Glarea lozoyensis (strain ATCC 74030 / MF5533) TaxID=1104152 RepID=H0EW91_GLAL7|nr:putative Zinc-regulated transporter 2 [Glarea lozoyensis 74030]
MVFAFSIGALFDIANFNRMWISCGRETCHMDEDSTKDILLLQAFWYWSLDCYSIRTYQLLPTAFYSLSDPCLPDLFIKNYPPMPGVIMMAALFALFVIELYLKGKTGGHSHGGPTGQGLAAQGAPHGVGGIGVAISAPVNYAPQRPPRSAQWDSNGFPVDHKDPFQNNAFEVDEYDEESRPGSYGGVDQAEMPPWFQAFFARYVRQREELKSAIASVAQTATAVAMPAPPPPVVYRETTDEPQMDAATFKKMSMNITLLEGGILFHSIFVGMTISITNDGFLILLIAILFHQFFEGLGLGSRIAAIPYPKRAIRPWVLVCAFGLTCPIGQVIGLLTRGVYDPASAFALIMVGVFNAISSGLLIYAATVDLLAEDFLSEEAQDQMTKWMKIRAFCFVLMGAAGMSVVGAFA